MKVLLLNGSTRKNGCTALALKEVSKALETEGIETELVEMGGAPIRDCIACGRCASLGRCVFQDDIVNQCIEKAHEADGFVFGSPVYYAHPSGRILSVLDRVFFAGKDAFAHKPGAAIVSAAAENGNGMYGGPNFCISFPSGAVSDKIVIFAGMTLPAPTG